MRLVENTKVVTGFAPATPSSSTPDFVSMRYYRHLTAIIIADNGNTVTGSAVTLKQSTVVAGSDEKALAFSKVYANTDTGASDALVETAVTSNTFTTNTTNAKNLLYVIELDVEELDVNNNFDCVRVGLGDAANTVISVVYILSEPRYAGAPPSAIVD